MKILVSQILLFASQLVNGISQFPHSVNLEVIRLFRAKSCR